MNSKKIKEKAFQLERLFRAEGIIAKDNSLENGKYQFHSFGTTNPEKKINLTLKSDNSLCHFPPTKFYPEFVRDLHDFEVEEKKFNSLTPEMQEEKVLHTFLSKYPQGSFTLFGNSCSFKSCSAPYESIVFLSHNCPEGIVDSDSVFPYLYYWTIRSMCPTRLIDPKRSRPQEFQDEETESDDDEDKQQVLFEQLKVLFKKNDKKKKLKHVKKTLNLLAFEFEELIKKY